MKPAPFVYHAPDTLDEAIELIAEVGDEGKILAGGQSLVPVMNMRLSQPQALVDICRIPGLAGIGSDERRLIIHATTRQAEVLRSPEVGLVAPLLHGALQHVGHPANRSRGTFGGSVAHADPAAELPSAVVALDAEIVVAGPRGERRIGSDDFFQTYFSTAVEPDEILTRIEVPIPSARQTWAFVELARRQGDFAIVGVALWATIAADDRVESARIVLLGVADVPTRAVDAENTLTGRSLSDPTLAAEVAARATDGLEPGTDLHASSIYRVEAAEVCVRRAVQQSAQRVWG
jgi:aerobic carbon-monoxide dehydrogenase medium subunit